jgi:hypothetical protein
VIFEQIVKIDVCSENPRFMNIANCDLKVIEKCYLSKETWHNIVTLFDQFK